MAELRENQIESRLVDGLTAKGFKVLKLTTPGHSGTPDRLILRPKWSPGPPWVIELKRPKKHERLLQEKVRDDWRARGVLVLDMVNTYEQVDALIAELYQKCLLEKHEPYVPRYCDHCGYPANVNGSTHCAPPFKRQPHEWTGKHPADVLAAATVGDTIYAGLLDDE